MKSILSVVRKSIAVIGAVAMMISLMTVIIPTQPAAAESAPAEAPAAAPYSEAPAAAESSAPSSEEAAPAAKIAAGKVLTRIALQAIGNSIAESRRTGTQYLVRINNETDHTVRFENICQWRGQGYWPLFSDNIEPGYTAYGVSARDEFQYAGVYRTTVPNSAQSNLVFGAFRRDPRIGSSVKRDLIDAVATLNCSRYNNAESAPWGDARNPGLRQLDVQTPPVRLIVRHLKTRFPPATNDVTVYEFRITNR